MKKIILTSILICVSFFSVLGAQLAGSGYHSMALKDDGTVWAWGDNTWGELGDGTTEEHLTPVQVSGLTDVISLSAGLRYSLALKRDGTVWAWGRNEYGQLGDGMTEERHTPVQVLGLSGVIAVDAHPGGDHSLAIKNDGTVWGWGENDDGELGDGTTTARRYPVQVQGLSLAASSPPASVLAADFDGDGKADPAMMDSSGNWYFWLSGSFYTRNGPYYLVLP